MHCRPIDSLDELLAWDAGHWTAQCRVAALNRPLPRSRTDRPPRRVLLCHDLRGNYLDDSACNGWKGTAASSSSSGQYTFVYWQCVDEFVYFSHHLVTVPPCGWVQAAHVHGVAVYGTLITEWAAGGAVCQRLFSCRQVAARVIERLVALSQVCGVDGWLVNIENDVSRQCLPQLVWFVGELRRQLCVVRPWARVIWYDAVSALTGRLAWQNELNEHNQPLLDVCDGLFLNYHWSRQGLQSSVARAGPTHARDVYVGVDVFGRGCVGGGGFNTCAALEAICDADAAGVALSVAVFAPSWTVEEAGAGEDIGAEHRFWQPLTEFLGGRGGATQWPLITTFCVGKGMCVEAPGHSASCAPAGDGERRVFYDLHRQSLQPSHFYLQPAACTVAYSAGHQGPDGGPALLVANASAECQWRPLFECALPLANSSAVSGHWRQRCVTDVAAGGGATTTAADGGAECADTGAVDSRGVVGVTAHSPLCTLFIDVCRAGDNGEFVARLLMSPSPPPPPSRRDAASGHCCDVDPSHVISVPVTERAAEADCAGWSSVQFRTPPGLFADVLCTGNVVSRVGVAAPPSTRTILGSISVSLAGTDGE